MATYPLPFTAQSPMSEKLQINHRQAPMESPHTFAMQVVHAASQWTLEFVWPRMTIAQAQVCQAWLDSLRGQVGTFRYTPRARTGSALTGRGLAQVAYAYGNTVRLSGWSGNAAGGVSVGQYFQLGNQLLRVTGVPANADANGQLLVEFEPMLRGNLAQGTAVNFANPSGLFRLATAETPSFTTDTDGHPTFPAVIAKEAF